MTPRFPANSGKLLFGSHIPISGAARFLHLSARSTRDDLLHFWLDRIEKYNSIHSLLTIYWQFSWNCSKDRFIVKSWDYLIQKKLPSICYQRPIIPNIPSMKDLSPIPSIHSIKRKITLWEKFETRKNRSLVLHRLIVWKVLLRRDQYQISQLNQAIGLLPFTEPRHSDFVAIRDCWPLVAGHGSFPLTLRSSAGDSFHSLSSTEAHALAPFGYGPILSRSLCKSCTSHDSDMWSWPISCHRSRLYGILWRNAVESGPTCSHRRQIGTGRKNTYWW